MTYRIALRPAAEDDLADLRNWIADEAGRDVARAYLDRVQAKFSTLAEFPNRGTLRPKLGKGFRSIPFERRRIIIYRVDREVVTVLRIVDGARDFRRLFS